LTRDVAGTSLESDSRHVRELAIVGGGAASPVVRRAVEDAAEVQLVAGPAEATALGNALLQGLSLGRFPALESARAWAARSGDGAA
jgi:rhamnulokinase